MISALILKDPNRFDYSSVISVFLSSLDAATSKIDFYFIEKISDSRVLNSILTRVYSTTRNEAHTLGWDYDLQINVLYNQEIPKESSYHSIFQSNDISTKSYPVVDANILAASPKNYHQGHHRIQEFNVVACGGTFDHLHDGHKILLSMTEFLTSKKIIIGITGSELLQNKKYSQVLQSFEKRESEVKAFLQLIQSNKCTQIDIYQINDICGPTGYIKEIDALVVSEETKKGGEFINNFRKEKGFPILQNIIIDVIGDKDSNHDNNWAGKLSSTAIRELEMKRK